MIAIADDEGADAIAHGATGKGNDQVRFELTAYALNPNIRVIAPWREWDLKGREDCVAYAAEHGIPVPVSRDKPYSTDAKPVPHQLRRGHPRGPLGRASRRHVDAHRRPGKGP